MIPLYDNYNVGETRTETGSCQEASLICRARGEAWTNLLHLQEGVSFLYHLGRNEGGVSYLRDKCERFSQPTEKEL